MKNMKTRILAVILAALWIICAVLPASAETRPETETEAETEPAA